MAGIESVLGDILYDSKTFEGNEECYVAFPRDKPTFRVVLNVDKFYPQNVSLKFINEDSKRKLEVKMIHDSRIQRPPTKLYQYAYKKGMGKVEQTAAGSSLVPSPLKDQSHKDADVHSSHDELRYSRDCTYIYVLPDGVGADSLSVVWTSNNFLVISSFETKDETVELLIPDSENYRVIPLHVACDDSPRIDLYSFRSFAREVFRCARDVLGDVENNIQLPEGQSILDGLKELNFCEDNCVIGGRNNLTDAYNGERNSDLPDEENMNINDKDLRDFLTALNKFKVKDISSFYENPLQRPVSTPPQVAFQPAVSTPPQVAFQPAVSTPPQVAVQPAVSTPPQVAFQPAVSTAPPVAFQPAVSTPPPVAFQPAVSTPPPVAFQPAVSTPPPVAFQPAVSTPPPVASPPPVETPPSVATPPSVLLRSGIKYLQTPGKPGK